MGGEPILTYSFPLLPLVAQVIDPWGGSYMMEALTDAVYQDAMSIIKEVSACRAHLLLHPRA